ncbi:P-loop NTPase fold protein [Ruegeria arenilitoris]|uniref:P-loop NTPase fold protein n=1 Tax=Ruegeria arenilitoris TaxID=1173585 RepID=UPI00147DDE2B|nr:P-loop NTPase fold protein [Ruegeria arenilitoris]
MSLSDIKDKDAFEMSSFISVIKDSLVRRVDQVSEGKVAKPKEGETTRATGAVVGLTGPWGSGKTFALDWIEKAIREDEDEKLLLVRFDPWRASGRDDLLVFFIEELAEEIRKSGKADTWKGVAPENIRWAKNLVVTGFQKTKGGIQKGLNVVKDGAGDVYQLALDGTIERKFSHISKKLSGSKLGVVCIIDDLDRLTDSEIRDVAMLVKSVGNIPNVSYLLSYDPRRVARALSENADIGEGLQYLEKIVQLQLRLPAYASRDLRRFAREELLAKEEEPWRDLSWSEMRRLLHDLIPRVIGTPRDIIRFSNIVHARRSALGPEIVHGNDLLRLCALEARFPLLAQKLSELIHHCTIDGCRELMRRPEVKILESSEVLEKLLEEHKGNNGKARDMNAEESMLQIMFPSLSARGSSRITRTINRVCFESTLKSVLSYQTTPDWMQKDEAISYLKNPESLREALAKAAKEQNLRHMHLQLRTVYDEAIKSADDVEAFWLTLAEHFDQTYSEQGLEAWHQFSDLSHIWARAVSVGFISKNTPDDDFFIQVAEGGFIHLSASVAYFSAESRGLFDVKHNPGAEPIVDTPNLYKLIGISNEKLKGKLLKGQLPVIKSLYPLWMAQKDEETYERLREALTSPKTSSEVDQVVCLVYRTLKDNLVDGVHVFDIIDKPRLLRAVRKHSDLDGQRPYLLQKAYRFVQDSLDGPV